MKIRIAKWLGYDSTPAALAPPLSRPGDDSATPKDSSDNATRRQLVQMLMRKLLHSNGIPPHWIECQMLLASSRTRGQGIYIRLVLKHFDIRFLPYLFAFQQTLRQDLERFEPKSATWLQGLSWQFDLADDWSHSTLPDRTFWQTAAAPAALLPTRPPPAPLQPAPAVPRIAVVRKISALVPYPACAPSVDERVEDIERLFAIRDRELASHADQDITPVGYEATQPSALRT